MGLSGWGSAKNMILRELAGTSDERPSRVARRSEGVAPPPVFSAKSAEGHEKTGEGERSENTEEKSRSLAPLAMTNLAGVSGEWCFSAGWWCGGWER